MTLYTRAGGEPQPLPYFDQDADENTWSDLENNAAGRAACGWVEAPPRPDVDPATATVTWVAGKWVVTPIPPAEQPDRTAALHAARLAAVEARLQRALLAGYAPTLPAFAGQRLQMRDADDKANWLTSLISYTAAVDGGFGDVIDASFRTAANATITVSYAEGRDVLLAMASWGRALLAHSWTLKDRIAADTDVEIEAGWPE